MRVVSQPRTSVKTKTYEAFLNLLKGLQSSDYVAIDFETRGNDISDPEFKAVGIGLSWNKGTTYLDLSLFTKVESNLIFFKLKDLPLIAHNVLFDGGVWLKEVGYWPNFRCCTYGLYRQLSNERNDLKWGLKSVMEEQLGWPSTNEKELDEWLVTNGYYKKTPYKEYKLGRVFHEGRYRSPEKGEMWRAPADILGQYCCLDADATYQFFIKCLQPLLKSMPKSLSEYHLKRFLPNVRILAEQQLSGITIDEDMLDSHIKYLTALADKTDKEFREHPEVKEVLQLYNQQKIQEVKDKEPPQFTKSGKESKNWVTWKTRLDKTSSTDHFNINSGKQLEWLYYDILKKEVLVRTKNGTRAVDKKALQNFGDSASVLIDYNTVVKELQYVEACKNRLRNGKLHPQFRAPGTLTGRLAGAGGLNIQQIPKSVGYLEAWKPDPGKVFLDCDHTSIEPVVLTELSRDPALMSIYGPGAALNDIYIYFGSFIPGVNEKLLSSGYDRDNPTPESIKKIKQTMKKDRNLWKVVHLAKQYGAGAGRIMQAINIAGGSISYDEAVLLSDTWNSTFKEVGTYTRELEYEWHSNGGWFLNGMGRPITVDQDYKKDILNRMIQSTAHDIHMLYVTIVEYLANKKRIKFNWLISDFHDQCIVECDEKVASKVFDLIGREAYDILNAKLQGIITIKGDPQYIKTFAEAKCDKEDIERWNARHARKD